MLHPYSPKAAAAKYHFAGCSYQICGTPDFQAREGRDFDQKYYGM
jgi:hypothetical protein